MKIFRKIQSGVRLLQTGCYSLITFWRPYDDENKEYDKLLLLELKQKNKITFYIQGLMSAGTISILQLDALNPANMREKIFQELNVGQALDTIYFDTGKRLFPSLFDEFADPPSSHKSWELIEHGIRTHFDKRNHTIVESADEPTLEFSSVINEQELVADYVLTKVLAASPQTSNYIDKLLSTEIKSPSLFLRYLSFETILDRIKKYDDFIMVDDDLQNGLSVLYSTYVDFIYNSYFDGDTNDGTLTRLIEGIKFCLENSQNYYNDEAKELIKKRFQNTDEEEI